MTPEKFGKYISYQEATKSQEATRNNIDNTPNAEQLQNMELVATNIFDKVREHFKQRIAVSSFFRSYELNKAIGGATNSQHSTGQAMDIDGDVYGMVKNSDIFNYIKDNLDFDQLIWEFGDNNEPAWVHVSYKLGVMRREILVGKKDGHKTVYLPYR